MPDNQGRTLTTKGMKRSIFLLLLTCGFALAGMSQKYAYVDTKYILEQIPAYKKAQSELDAMSEKWQKEMEAKYAEIEQKDKAYQEEKILLPDEIKKKREAEIAELLEGVREFQRKKFGVQGELFEKRQELIKPIQDKLYNAIKAVAKDKYDMVFDKANQSNLLYASKKYDISQKVLDKMGVK